MLPRPPPLLLDEPPMREPNMPAKPAASIPLLCCPLPKSASTLGAIEDKMLLTELVATPVELEMPLNTLERLPPKIWLKILEPSVRSAPLRLSIILPALPAWLPRACDKEAAPDSVEAFFCMAPKREGNALVMTEETCFESILNFCEMAPMASLLVKAPKMLVKSIISWFKLIIVD